MGYKQVTVLQGAGGENGKTVYRYTSPIDFPDFQSFTVPFPPATSADYGGACCWSSRITPPIARRPPSARSPIATTSIPAPSSLEGGLGETSAGQAISGADFLDRYAWEGYGNVLGYARLVETKEALLYAAVPAPDGAPATSHENHHLCLR